MAGPLAGDELARVQALRQPDQEVVLGTWALLLDRPAAELAATVPVLLDAAREVPYLSLHGIDPGPEYEGWLRAHLPDVEYEVWPDHGHYPHLVDHDRFMARLAEFEAEVRGMSVARRRRDGAGRDDLARPAGEAQRDDVCDVGRARGDVRRARRGRGRARRGAARRRWELLRRGGHR